ncbi:MAG: hypothetical protein R3345_13290 [Fulvivirga sp.]|nr:hypothetical protein [Fulvivirga sp.]
MDKELWKDERFRIEKWEDTSKYKLEALRQQAEMMWNRKVTIQEIAERAVDYAYKGLSLQILEEEI